MNGKLKRIKAWATPTRVALSAGGAFALDGWTGRRQQRDAGEQHTQHMPEAVQRHGVHGRLDVLGVHDTDQRGVLVRAVQRLLCGRQARVHGRDRAGVRGRVQRAVTDQFGQLFQPQPTGGHCFARVGHSGVIAVARHQVVTVTSTLAA